MMYKNLTSMVLVALAVCAITACSQKPQEVTLQVKTQSGVVEGFEQDGVKKFYRSK